MMKVGIIGCGYWGGNLIRNFSSSPKWEVTLVCDQNPTVAAQMKTRYPIRGAVADATALIRSPDVDAVVIATSIQQHYKLATQALSEGKHVLVEKPMATSLHQAQELVRLARKKKCVLMVDHTFLYTGAVRKIREIIQSGELGKIHYFDSVRVNLGLIRPSHNVIWDLAPHDYSIMDYLFKQKPVTVSAHGASHLKGQPENIAFVVMEFDNQMIAHFHFNWIAPTKMRYTLVGGSKKMIVYNDLETDEKVKVYSKSVAVKDSRESVYQPLYDYRVGDMYAPKIDLTEALQKVAEEFAHSIEKNKAPLTDGVSGLRVVKLLAATQKSLRAGGRAIKIAWDSV